MKKNKKTESQPHAETRNIVIYGYSHQEISQLLRHFKTQLPASVGLDIYSENLVTRIRLTGNDDGSGVELLRFKINMLHQNLQDIFNEDVVSKSDKSVSQVLGDLLTERELTVSCAESCTGGNLAHRITLNPGSSDYFLGSIVSYSNDVKANVLSVSRSAIDAFGAVSRQVAEAMVGGVAELMHSDCAIATTGIAGPGGGTRFKPVGTVWIAAKYLDTVVSECVHFDGDRNAVIESASDHGMVMLIKLLRNSYIMQEDFNDE